MNEPAWDRHHPQVPVDDDGNMLHYPHYRNDKWEHLYPFYAEMKIDGMTSGRSAKYLNLRDQATGRTYPMFVSDIVAGINSGLLTIKDTVLYAWWGAAKKGANYGIKPVEGEL